VHVTLNVILFFHKSLPKEPQHFCRSLWSRDLCRWRMQIPFGNINLHTSCALGLFSILENLCERSYIFLGVENIGRPCATCRKLMSFNHLHLWPLDVKRWT
jgi:hypothetical protein